MGFFDPQYALWARLRTVGLCVGVDHGTLLVPSTETTYFPRSSRRGAFLPARPTVSAHDWRAAKSMRLTALLLVSPEHQGPLLRHLNSAGMEAIIACSLSEVLQLLSFLPQIDSIFVDEQWPGGAWRQVLESISCSSPATLAVICCHGSPSDHVWQEAASLGAYDLIADGMDEQAVCDVVQAVLLRGRLRERRLRRLKPVRKAVPNFVEDSALSGP